MDKDLRNMSHSPTADPWEEGIASLLEDLSDVQDQLLIVLAEKRQRMAAGDLPGMAELQEVEQSLCERLKACHDRRANLLSQANECGILADGLGDLASAVNSPGKGDLRQQVSRASSRMRLLQHQSVANWVVAQMALLHASQMLEIIATGGRFQPTYGRERNPETRGGLVDQEV